MRKAKRLRKDRASAAMAMSAEWTDAAEFLHSLSMFDQAEQRTKIPLWTLRQRISRGPCSFVRQCGLADILRG
jgi:hypothetical protein